MRFIDVGLMALPVALVIAWFLGARRLGIRGFTAIALVLLATGGALFWMGRARSFTGPYMPARLHDGRVIQGQSG